MSQKMLFGLGRLLERLSSRQNTSMLGTPLGVTAGASSCSVRLSSGRGIVLGLDRDFQSSLLVFSVFSRGVKVQSALAAASNSLLTASALHMHHICLHTKMLQHVMNTMLHALRFQHGRSAT